MSRRRGEFEHRTSIFEGAFRAWSYLGGLDPHDLEAKTLSELDPLTSEAEERSRSDPRLKSSDFAQESPDGDDDKKAKGRRIYPYEPLPRSGLAHPFVQAILSPWLGPDAEQNAIQLGLTTLRTWWQHRRKGESGSAVSALGTDKMRGVVEGYTRHFFSLAYCLVTNDGEQPPRSLHSKMKELEKARAKRYKKRAREEEAGKLAALALNAGLAHGLNAQAGAAGGAGPGAKPGGAAGGLDASALASLPGGAANLGSLSAGAMGANPGAAGAVGNGTPDESHLSPLERLALAHQRQQQQNQMQTGLKVPGQGVIKIKGKCIPGKLDMQQLALQVRAHGTQVMHQGGARGIVTPDVMNSASNMALGATAVAGQGAATDSFGPQPMVGPAPCPTQYQNNNQEEEPETGTTPVVLISPKGEIQIAMSVDGITCAHCVKIVETVLKGCNGNRSPISGLLDAAADHELCSVIIKIDKSSNAKRIARESARNLAMVGYTAKVKEMNISDVNNGCCNGGPGGKMNLNMLNAAFDVVAAQDPMNVFDWGIQCTCPDNGVLRQDCKRHSQMNSRIFHAFEQRQAKVQEYMTGCARRFGQPCSCGDNCKCKNGGGCCDKSQQNQQQQQQAQLPQMPQQQALPQDPQAHPLHQHAPQAASLLQQQKPDELMAQHHAQNVAMPQPHQQVELSQAQIAEHLTAAAAAAANNGRNMRANSIGRMPGQTETFGRAMSGLSQLSIDWENMEDFDVNIDHSAHINNSYLQGAPVRAPGPGPGGVGDDDRTDGIMAGCAMMTGGECNCGPTCFCVGCPIHDKPNVSMGLGSSGGSGGGLDSRRVVGGLVGGGGGCCSGNGVASDNRSAHTEMLQDNMHMSFKM